MVGEGGSNSRQQLLAVRWSEVRQEVGYERHIVALAEVDAEHIARDCMIPARNSGILCVCDGCFEYRRPILRKDLCKRILLRDRYAVMTVPARDIENSYRHGR